MTESELIQAKLVAEVKALRQRVAELEAAGIQRQRAAAVLQVSEARYRRLFETAQDGLLMLNAGTGRITDVNPGLMKLLGYSRGEFVGKRLWEIGLFKDSAAMRTAFSELQSHGCLQYENLPLEASDGRLLNVEFVSNVYWVDQQRVIQCNIRDVTARAQAEAALSESMIELQTRNEELDAFAHTVAHDLKNPAFVISGNAQLLLRDYAALSDEERQRHVKIIEQTGRQIGTIIDELLLLSRLRKAEVEISPLDMVRIVAQSISRLADNIKAARAEIVWPDFSAWPMVLGHGPWIEEVWTNYLSNALQYGVTPPAAHRIGCGPGTGRHGALLGA
jgi:PAS domain S-box-containing protein